MRLITLGGLRLKGSSFTRPKPLLLITYLALEGPHSRRDIANIFFSTTKDSMQSLRSNLLHIGKEAGGAVQHNEQKVWTELPCDALELLEAFDQGDYAKTLELYKGPFLEDFDASDAGEFLETWLLETREKLASKARDAHLALGELAAAQGNFSDGAKHAEGAYLLRSAPEPDIKILERMYVLLRAHNNSHHESVAKEAKNYGLELSLSLEEAKAKLTVHGLQSSGPPAASFSGLEARGSLARDYPAEKNPQLEESSSPKIERALKQRPRRLGIVLTLVVVAGLLAGFLAFRKPTADLPEPSEASVSIDDADIALYEDYWCGSYTALDLSSSIPEQNTAIRFPVEVPPNTTLTNATLRFVAAKTVEDFKGSGFVIRGVFNASPWLVSDVCDDSQAAARDYRSRARTETSVSYQPSEWQRDKPYPIDVTAIVQEVINSPSWTGGAIAFAIEKFPDALVDITAYSSESSGNDPNKQTTLALYYAISSALKTVEASQ